MESTFKESGSPDWVRGSVTSTYTSRTGSVTVNTWTPRTNMEYSFCRGQNLSNYHARKKRGELLPMTSWLKYKATGKITGGDWDVTCKFLTLSPSGQTSTEVWSPTGYSVVNSNHADYVVQTEKALQDRLLEAPSYEPFVQACASKIYSSGWDGLTFAAELHKTLQMLQSFRKNLVTNITKLRPEASWLELRYCWRTLLYDMQDIEQMIYNIDGERRRFSEAVGYTNKFTATDSEIKSFTSCDVNLYRTEAVSVGTRGMIAADILPPEISFNPVATGWELITLSFVVDWFIGIGRWIEAMSFLTLQTDYTAAGGYSIKVERSVATLTEYKDTTDHNYSDESNVYGGASEGTSELLVRIPTSVSYFPQINVNLNALKVLDLAALASQFLRRK